MEYIELMPIKNYALKIRLFLDGQDISADAFWTRVPAEPGIEIIGEVKLYSRPMVKQSGSLKFEQQTGNVCWVWKAV